MGGPGSIRKQTGTPHPSMASASAPVLTSYSDGVGPERCLERPLPFTDCFQPCCSVKATETLTKTDVLFALRSKILSTKQYT